MGIMNLLDKIVYNNFEFDFIDIEIRKKINIVYEKGIDCILKM